MQKLEMMFALMATVALAGVVFSSVGIAAAQNPKFLTLHSAEQNNFTNVERVCNANFMYSENMQYNCGPCNNRASENAFSNAQKYCTPKALEDCPVSDNSPICWCSNETTPENC